MRIALLPILLLLGLQAFAQLEAFESDYQPIRLEGPIPPEFLINQGENTKKEIENRKNLSKKDAESFYTESNYILRSLMSSGYVYFNDPITKRVNQVAAEITKHIEAKEAEELRFFVTQFDVPNAFCWRNGYIFLNVGLLKDLDNEAQLAFILSHEINHYLEKHSLKFYKKKNQKKKGKKKKKSKTDRKKRQEIDEVLPADIEEQVKAMRFSRMQETEADMEGLKLYLKTKYAPEEAVNALKKLKDYESEDYSFVPIDLSLFFNNKHFTIDSSNLYKEGNRDTVLVEVDDPDRNEKMSTHPDIDKRIAAVEAFLVDNNKKGVSFIHSEEEWETMIEGIYFEALEYYHKSGDFILEFYLAIRLLEDYPDNVYVKETLARSIFWTGHYLGAQNVKISEDEVKGNYSYFLYYIARKGGKEDFVLGQLNALQEENPDNPKIALFLARAQERFGNKKESKKHYKSIQKKTDASNFIKHKSKS